MNQLSQQELWEKIQTFQLDDPTSTFPFSKKLAAENNWSPAFTNRAIEEYKRFIFLCCISPTGASPSEIVDEVWHLHLTYTDSYWIKFCKHTLQKDIHHHPSKGGSTESEKHVKWYADTLILYEATFNSKAPADIWPPNQTVQQTVSFDEPVYTPAFLKQVVFFFSAALIIFIFTVNLYSTKGPDFLNYYFLITIAGLIVLLITQLHKDNRLQLLLQNNQPKNFTPYQMARFLYGNHRCYQTALVDLLNRGIIETSGIYYKLVKYELFNFKEENPLLEPLMKAKALNETFTYDEGLGLIDRDTVLHADLETLNLLSKKVDYSKLIVPGIVLLIGFGRFLQGLSNDKPVGLLVLEMGVFSVISLMILQSYSYTKTVRQHVTKFWSTENNNGHGSNIINNFTILGTAAIFSFPEYAILTQVFDSIIPKKEFWGRRATGDGSGCSGGGGCSSGCSSGGGGCGGGCGGCGGGD